MSRAAQEDGAASGRDARVAIEVYQCPRHKAFRTLVVDDTRYGTSKCCPRQYTLLIAEWRLDESEVGELCESLNNALERAKEPSDEA